MIDDHDLQHVLDLADDDCAKRGMTGSKAREVLDRIIDDVKDNPARLWFYRGLYEARETKEDLAKLLSGEPEKLAFYRSLLDHRRPQ